jgi:hypothetical protein
VRPDVPPRDLECLHRTAVPELFQTAAVTEVSMRNSRTAKAARRASRAPVYPVMPPGECYGSSKVLAACYPELRYAEGTRTFTVRVLPDGHEESSTIEHAWNVAADGGVWDSTLNPEVRAAALRHQVQITYAEGEDTQGVKWEPITKALLEQITGLTGKRKREAIESFGRWLAMQPS